MIKKLLILLLAISWSNVNGQNPDSTIFNSVYEKTLFRHYLAGHPVGVIDILKAVNYTPDSENFESRIFSFCEEMKLDGIEKLKTKKFINALFERVHARFLKKYEEIAYFDQIFSDGIYNCVTATALYVIVFDYFKVDYVIHETSDHVYLIADPKGTSFLIETTMPANGVVTYDDRYKKTYVDYLLENKMISDWEYKSNALDDLFQKYYRAHTEINSRQLASLQYYNAGIKDYEDEKFMDAYHNFEKVNILHPTSNLNFMLSNTIVQLLIAQNAQRVFQAEILGRYISLNKKSKQALKMAEDFFTEVSNELTIKHPSSVVYKSYYQKLMESFPDSLPKSDFEEIYNSHLAYYYYVKRNYDKVIYYAGNSYHNNPENLQTRQMLYEALLGNFQELENEDKLETDSLTYYVLKYPFLLENEGVLQGISLMFQSEYNHSSPNNKEVIAESVKKMEDFGLKLSELPDGKKMAEKLYLDAIRNSSGLYRFEAANAYLKSGLKILPESDELKGWESKLKKSQKDYDNFSKVIYPKNSPPNYIHPPDYDSGEVEASIKKYLNTCWKVDFYKKDGKTRETEVGQMQFTFYPDARVKFKTGTEEHWGTWKLQSAGPKLILQGDEDGERFSILIYEAGPTQMRGIVSPYTAENKKIEFNICKK